MSIVSILPYAELGPNDHREDGPHFRYNLCSTESVPLLNMTSAAPLFVVLSLLSQRKEGKRGRSVSHV